MSNTFCNGRSYSFDCGIASHNTCTSRIDPTFPANMRNACDCSTHAWMQSYADTGCTDIQPHAFYSYAPNSRVWTWNRSNTPNTPCSWAHASTDNVPAVPAHFRSEYHIWCKNAVRSPWPSSFLAAQIDLSHLNHSDRWYHSRSRCYYCSNLP